MYQLEEPSYFLLLFIIPVVVLFFIISLWIKKRRQKAFASVALFNKLSPDKSLFKSVLKLISLSLALVCLAIALVNPKMGIKLETIKREGVDVVFALDVSKSMLAEDIAPNRLEKAKQIIAKIIDKLGSDRVGIIVYAGSAYPLLPITTDMAAAKMFLQNADPNMVSSQGTAINEALNRALTFYDNEEQTNKYLVLLSDGEDHENQSESIAKTAAKQGIKIFTIGIGTETGKPIPIRENGIFAGYKKDQKGEVVITQRHADVLKTIASEGAGSYMDGNLTNTPVKFMEETLVNAQKHEYESKQFSDYKDQFQWFIGLAIFFLIFDSLLFEKKTQWLKKIDLFNESK
ncbi:MAG: VWA domain-containing protein [Zetaproteobacteria bacterium]|nr:VWA domain-containing protein [Zetaproteobacteria bacterium]